mmetsp:Transcript_90915/g.282836  ORF Transcript_90915/g.282836 Transcript_90915/m.282836 type:complete len:489 (+) Transcript_90915:85-1551(+)
MGPMLRHSHRRAASWPLAGTEPEVQWRPPSEAGDPLLALRVLTLGGEEVAALALAPSTSVEALRLEVQVACGVPAAKQRLVWQGAVLVDGRSLAASGLREGGTVTLVQVPRCLALSGGADGSLLLWDLESGDAVEALPRVHSRRLHVLVADWPSRRALSSAADQALVLWNMDRGQPDQTLDKLATAASAADVDWVGNQALVGFYDGALVLLSLNGDRPVQRMQGHRSRVTQVAADWSGMRALSASYDRTIVHWDLARNEVLQTLTGHKGVVMAAAAEWRQRRVLSGGADNMLILWGLEDALPIDFLRGHTGTVRAINVDWAARLALSASADATLGLWDLQGPGLLLGRLRGHGGEVTCLAVDWQGLQALSADSQGVLILWDIKRCEAIRAMRNDCCEVTAITVDWRDNAALAGATEKSGSVAAREGLNLRRTREVGGVEQWLHAAEQAGAEVAAQGGRCTTRRYRPQLLHPGLTATAGPRCRPGTAGV